MVIRRDSQRRVDQALCAAAELWDSGPDWAVLPWWIVGCAAGSPGESAAEEEQEQESELGGHRRGQTGSHEMLWGLEPRLPSQEQESELLDTSEGEILLAGHRRGQTGSQWCPEPRRPSQEQESELLDTSEHYSGAPEGEMLLAGHRRGQTGSHEMLLAGHRRGQTGSQWCPEPRRPSQEQESELLDSSEYYSGAPEGEMLLAGHRRGQTGSQWGLEPRRPYQGQEHAAAGVWVSVLLELQRRRWRMPDYQQCSEAPPGTPEIHRLTRCCTAALPVTDSSQRSLVTYGWVLTYKV